MKELINIQADLIAPKGQYNSFGKYNYRSCEDILVAVKPLLTRENCELIISDEVIEVGGSKFVKATATLRNSEGQETVANGWAMHAEDKKGMDASQVTGSTSSYARKYALNGLFCIDDNKDADATNTHGKGEENNYRGKNSGGFNSNTAKNGARSNAEGNQRQNTTTARGNTQSQREGQKNTKSDVDKENDRVMLNYLAGFNVSQEELEGVLGKSISEVNADDKAQIRLAVAEIKKLDCSFAEAWAMIGEGN